MTHTHTLTLRHRIAQFARRAPWLIAFLQSLYQKTRPRYTLGVTGIVFNERGEVLLVEHVLHPRHPWGPPGGWVDPGETPQQTITREMREEVGLSVTVHEMVNMELLPDEHHIDFAYRCTAESTHVGPLSGELLGYRWFPLDALPDVDPFQRAAIEHAARLPRAST